MLYGNERTKQLIASMISKGREPHSIIITGESGSGKRTLAGYIAQALFCEEHTGVPCGRCRQCRMQLHGNHPDFINVRPNENGNYQIDTMRALVGDAVISPNEGRAKVYLIADLDRSPNTAAAAQNVLLKLIEEPPEHCFVIITAAAKEIFLKTVISRVLSLSTEPVSRDDAEEWLRSLDKYDDEDISRAAAACGGCLGRCIELIESKENDTAADCAISCCEAIAAKDEYLLLKALTEADGKKAVLRQVFMYIAEAANALTRRQLGLEGRCIVPEALMQRLLDSVSPAGAQALFSLAEDYALRIDLNCNLSLTVNSFTARLRNRMFV